MSKKNKFDGVVEYYKALDDDLKDFRKKMKVLCKNAKTKNGKIKKNFLPNVYSLCCEYCVRGVLIEYGNDHYKTIDGHNVEDYYVPVFFN